MSSSFPGEWKAAYARYFARKFVRRLKAEEIYDSMVHATGLYTEVPIRGTDFRAKYATETRSPEDFKGKGPILKDVNFFLESFGQTNREFSERTNEGDITQAILLMNSPFVLRQIKAAPGSYLAMLLERATHRMRRRSAGCSNGSLCAVRAADELAMATSLVRSNAKRLGRSAVAAGQQSGIRSQFLKSEVSHDGPSNRLVC